jgi:hypothetical protein
VKSEKKSIKKLHINRESIRKLVSEEDLKKVVGGDNYSEQHGSCIQSCLVCHPIQ